MYSKSRLLLHFMRSAKKTSRADEFIRKFGHRQPETTGSHATFSARAVRKERSAERPNTNRLFPAETRILDR